MSKGPERGEAKKGRRKTNYQSGEQGGIRKKRECEDTADRGTYPQ